MQKYRYNIKLQSEIEFKKIIKQLIYDLQSASKIINLDLIIKQNKFGEANFKQLQQLMKAQINTKITTLSPKITKENQQYSEPSQFYDHAIQSWVSDIKKYFKGQFQYSPLSIQYFSRCFLDSVERNFKLKVQYDLLIAKSITKLLERVQYQRYSLKEPDLDLFTLQKGEKWIFLVKISYILYQSNFIPKSKLYKILQYCSEENSLQARLLRYRQTLQFEKQGVKKLRISPTKWNQIVKIGCKQFWTKVIFIWPNVINNKTVIQIFKMTENFLSTKLTEQEIKQIKKTLSIKESIQKPKIQMQFLQSFANELDIFNYPEKVQSINIHFENFKKTLKKIFQGDKKIYQVRFQTYGSFRNKICLPNSDIDLTIFVYNSTKILNTQRKFISDCLWKIYNYLKDKKIEFNISGLHPIIKQKVKVPFIKVLFQKMPIKKIDIVINNEHGVKNSRMIQRFAENKIIRQLCLLIKQWAKKNQLINQRRLSSFGVTLMILYFMMRTGLLEFISFEQLEKFSYSSELKHKNFTLIGIFQRFCTFYSSEGEFQRKDDVVCLIKSCKRHQEIFQPDRVINMHDPFEGQNPNPGRMKLNDRFLLYEAFDNARKQCQQLKILKTKERKQKLYSMFNNIQKFTKQPVILD